MANFLSNIFKKSEGSVLGIDIGASAIKIVQIRKKGARAVLETYGTLSLGPYAGVEIGRATVLQPEKVIAALTDILREAKTTTRKGGLTIPFGSTLMSVIEMPSVDPRQMASMVPIEARKYIPVPITEVSLDWSVVPKEEVALRTEEPESADKAPIRKTKMEDVLLVAIHNETLREYQEIVKKVNLEANFFEIEIFSTIRAVLDKNISPVLILDMGAASTKLYIVDRGIVRASHTISRGSQDVTLTLASGLSVAPDKAEILKRTIGWEKGGTRKDVADIISLTVDHIFSEAKHVISNYQTKHMKSIEKAILVGGGSNMKGFTELAQAGLQMPVELGDPFSKVEAPAFLTDVLKKNGPEFTAALGIALRRIQE
ncbi:MAG TPA: type IV pilus assembly protein PilM [Candidatus Nanoarchaeia archaeon]|nr:type IV pilus assembly protein PilM [Candidatus Nanoarchaeia archaeon]